MNFVPMGGTTVDMPSSSQPPLLTTGDNRLVESELREALRASMEENGMLFDAGELDDLTRALWEDAGMPQDGSGEMSLQVS